MQPFRRRSCYLRHPHHYYIKSGIFRRLRREIVFQRWIHCCVPSSESPKLRQKCSSLLAAAALDGGEAWVEVWHGQTKTVERPLRKAEFSFGCQIVLCRHHNIYYLLRVSSVADFLMDSKAWETLSCKWENGGPQLPDQQMTFEYCLLRNQS